MIKLPFTFDKNQKQTMILIVLVSVIAFIFYLNFLLVPQLVGVFGSFVKMNEARFELAKAKEDIARIDKLKNDLAAIQEKMDLYEKMLPAEQPISGLLENLNAVAKSSNVKITAITPNIVKEDKARKDTPFQEIPIHISAKSGYHELGNFLARLEGGERFMKIVDIAVKSNSSNPKKHDIELVVMTYKMKKGG
ncbi:MAG: type 4a pilus biogenesis protein PilO [Candidatus Omnitrophota bacterium]|nr:type 4a pilus biogenesis protein PilO [Candidatus Omnitrophota bacterium]